MSAKTSTSRRLWKSESARVRQMHADRADLDTILKTVKISIDNHTDFSRRGVRGKMTIKAAKNLWDRLRDFATETRPTLPGDPEWTVGWRKAAFQLRDQQLARIDRMHKAGSRLQTMHDAVWLAIQSHTHRKPSQKGHVPADVGTAIWLYLLPFIDGDGPGRASKGRHARMPGKLRVYLDAAKDQRREDYFRAGTTYEGGPIHDPAYEEWLINHDRDPVAYLAQFDPEDGWEAPPWAAKYGVVWPDSYDFEDDGDDTSPDAEVVELFPAESRELVTT